MSLERKIEMMKYTLYAILFLLWIAVHGFIYIDCMLAVKFHLDGNYIANAALVYNYSYSILDILGVVLIILLLTEVFLLVHIAGNKSMNRKYIIITVSTLFVVAIALCYTVFYANNVKIISIISEIKDVVVKVTYKLAGISMLNVAFCLVGIWMFKKKSKCNLE